MIISISCNMMMDEKLTLTLKLAENGENTNGEYDVIDMYDNNEGNDEKGDIQSVFHFKDIY